MAPKRRGKVYERIQLPIPANVSYSDNAKYNEGSGIAGKILPSLAKQIANGADAANIAQTVQAAASAGSAGLVMSMLDKLPGLGGGAAQITQNGFEVWVIPHTYKLTNISKLKKNSLVNIEIDILSKYVKKYFYEK